MDVQHAQRTDALLSPYLQAASEAESEWQLTRLLAEEAGPIIAGIIRSKLHASDAVDDRLRWQDSEDVYGEVVAQLLARLRDLKSNRGNATIESFRSYVAVVTYNACNHHLRRKYPQRWRLKNRIRYLLTHNREFALWENSAGDWLCGFAEFSEQGKDSSIGSGRLRELCEPRQTLSSNVDQDLRSANLDVLLRAVFRTVGAAVELDAVVNTVAELQGIKDLPSTTEDDQDDLGSAADMNVTADLERRSYLQRLWSEIIRLPIGQRVALLLNLRDLQEGVIMLLPMTGIATIRQIAEAVAIPADEFARLWNDLPLDDAAVALRLGITRQQVINLRKSARARLIRRMTALDRTAEKQFR
jgi:hypothetical protein